MRGDRRTGEAFLERPIEGSWPYLWIDESGRIASVAVIIAVGVNSDGRREVLGMAPVGSRAVWAKFLRSLTRRGLRGVKLVISDAHEGLKAAAAKVLSATWHRCRVHFMRIALAHVLALVATDGGGCQPHRLYAGDRRGA